MNVTSIIVFLGYLCAALYWFRLSAKRAGGSTPQRDWMFWVDVFFAPAGLLGLLVMGLVLTPFWWLYPERHAQAHDFTGTAEQQAELQQWRDGLAKKSFWKRLGEKLSSNP